MAMLLWLCNGVLKLRAVEIDAMVKNILSDHEVDTTYYPHPHYPFGFTDIPRRSQSSYSRSPLSYHNDV